MSPKFTRPSLPLLVDANIVIEAYKISVWNPLIGRLRVAIPSIVIDDEALFYSSDLGNVPVPIRLPSLVANGSIERVEATNEEMSAVLDIFDRVFVEGIHPGEHEALAIIMHRSEEYQFCSSDVVAIKALTMLGYSDRGVSMESVLTSIGLTKKLDKQFTEAFFRNQIAAGQVQRIQGTGLKKGKKI